MITRGTGAAWAVDPELLASLNLRYALFEWSDNQPRGALLELVDGRLERKGPVNDEEDPVWESAYPLPQFLSDHADEIQSIVDEFRAIVMTSEF